MTFIMDRGSGDLTRLDADIAWTRKTMSEKELTCKDANYKPKVIGVFGSSRCVLGSEEFEEARLLGSRLVDCGFEVLTGGYAGVMEAASLGAFEAAGTVRAITLRDWGPPNRYVKEFEEAADLFGRQKLLIERADAFVALYGGPGTLSEVSLVWALNQSTLMVPPRPLVLIGNRWKEIVAGWAKFLHANEEDISFLALASTVEDALKILLHQLSGLHRDGDTEPGQPDRTKPDPYESQHFE